MVPRSSRRVVFSGRTFLLAAYVALVHPIYLPLTATALVLDETRCCCSTSQLLGESDKALVVGTVTVRSHRLVVMPREARGGGLAGHGKRRRSCCLLGG